MQSKRARLDRFLGNHLGIKRGDVRPILASGRVAVDGVIAVNINQLIDQFTHVTLDNQVVQAHQPVYLMMNKPVGVVSATVDKRHTTVIDLLHHPDRHSLHIVGRLDFNSSGLLLLTNDGRWSRQLTTPERKIPKLYRVTLETRITEDHVEDYVKAFAAGMYFAYEGITTRPAQLRIVSEHEVEVSLEEGRYHQIKRMFGRFRNKVVGLHRIAIGNLQLDPALKAGQGRELTGAEVLTISQAGLQIRGDFAPPP